MVERVNPSSKHFPSFILLFDRELPQTNKNARQNIIKKLVPVRFYAQSSFRGGNATSVTCSYSIHMYVSFAVFGDLSKCQATRDYFL